MPPRSPRLEAGDGDARDGPGRPLPRRRVLKTIAYVAPAVVAIGLTADRAFASGGPKIAAPVAKRQSQDRAPVKKK